MKFMKNKTVSLTLLLLMLWSNLISFAPLVVQAAELGQGVSQDLFISEYIEGSSYNKALEIYNGTGEGKDLSQYGIKVYFNGATTASQEIQLTGTLASGDTYVLYHASADQTIKMVGDLESSALMNHNGNDAIELIKGDIVIDTIGKVGENPKDAWSSEDGKSTKDNTLVRKSEISKGNTTFNFNEWDSFPKDTFSEIGKHEMTVATEEPKDKELIILHTNDVHGNVEEDSASGKIGYAKYKTIIEEYEANNKNVLVLDAGDATHGTNLASLSDGVAVVELMNMLGVDGFVPGNHDFNYGFASLKNLESLAEFPVLASNVVDSVTKNVALEDGVIIPMEGFEVGVFGLATPETKVKSNPKNTEGLDFVDEVVTANRVVADLEKQGADVIILLSHLGMDKESEVKSTDIAAQVKGIDVIVDGHSHTLLENGMKSGNSFIVSTGEHMKNIGVTTVDLESDVVKDLTSEMINYEEAQIYEADTEILEKIEEINGENKEKLQKVVGKTETVLDGVREHVRAAETDLGNLITDAMKFETGADVALTNGGGIRANIDAGDITMGDILTVLPFGNTSIVIKVTGQEILDALTFGVDAYPGVAGKFPHVAGMTYEIEVLESGNIVRNLRIGEVPVDLDKSYTLATNDFMAVGGDGYTMFAGKEQVSLHGLLAEVLADYVAMLTEKDGAVRYTVEGRITKYVKDLEFNEEKQIGDTTISVKAEPGVIEAGTVVEIKPILEENSEMTRFIQIALGDEYGQYQAFDINLLNDGVKVQPDGTITISISIPEGFNEDRISVFRINEDGTKTRMDGKVIDGHYIFTTDHLSLYALTEAKEEIIPEEPKTEDPKTEITKIEDPIVSPTQNTIINTLDTIEKTPETGDDANIAFVIIFFTCTVWLMWIGIRKISIRKERRL